MENDEKVKIIEALTKGGNVNIGQLSIGDNNKLEYHNHPREAEEPERSAKKEISADLLARAIENCQDQFWGNSAYAVLFCIFRDDLKNGMSQSSFERMIGMLPYRKRLDHVCNTGTIANAFSDNDFLKSPIDKWTERGASQRALLLVNKLREELKL